MERKQYYVSIASKEISEVRIGNNDDFTIQATTDDIKELEQIFSDMSSAEMDTFWRAHVPIVPYHRDKGNDHYDAALSEAYAKMYELGDEQARTFLSASGLLDTDQSDL